MAVIEYSRDEQLRWEGKEEGIKEGIKEGRKEEQRKMILKMYRKGMNISAIEEIAEIPAAEIQKLLESSFNDIQEYNK